MRSRRRSPFDTPTSRDDLMPDWSYRTVFQPLLFRLPYGTARALALGSMGRLARVPGGRTVIDLMGHMAPDERLQTSFASRTVSSPLMLGCSVDPHLTALPALARFGFGLIEIGPVGASCELRKEAFRIDVADETLISAADAGAFDVTTAVDRLQRAGLDRETIIVRLGEPATSDTETAIDTFRRIIAQLAPLVGTFALPLELIADAEAVAKIVSQLVPTVRDHHARLLVVADADRNEGTAVALSLTAIDAGADGIVVDATQTTVGGDIARGPQCHERARQITRSLRAKLRHDVPIIAGGGVHEPLDAVRLIADGATLVQIDSGLIVSGPGLPKRINDALLCQRMQSESAGGRATAWPPAGERGAALGTASGGQAVPIHEATSSLSAGCSGTIASGNRVNSPSRPGRQAWLWTLLMGIAMLIGGVMAMTIALTRVVMPYDEQFVGMTRSQLAALNDRLLLFMRHDRVTLAGTMLAVGLLYTLLSWCGIRRGWHWAHVAVIASAFVGFCTFFSFLGFGYFDPLHAFVTVILFQFLLLGVHADSSRPAYDDVPNLTNHAAWRCSLWGQLLYVIHGAMLIVAGCVICSYGMTSVFVPEDLEFMQTTAEALCTANPQLVPLVAHDRATFGGMLIACGITVLLSAMWGFRQGSGWLWWALFAGGNVAYIAVILVHWHVDYTSLKHLLPAYAGLLLIWLAATLSRRYLCETNQTDAAHWRELLTPRSAPLTNSAK